ncbi:MAG: DUF4292 domain-containing protein [Vicingaceae bacterium]|jgi:uncharacterized protein DUF4292|nr:DUF4292 domain-containing protein [Flavobacteriales bacterium]MBQ20408.1 hypothetical protein [Flavobacteriales bacterium]MDF1675944.1 DUF4292 domain-containing protein [Vicingaceae bacterium]|tara:strand:- start:63939 stop:64778 length:840 start_codon:yes stop_codon:yes gene_type:complete
MNKSNRLVYIFLLVLISLFACKSRQKTVTTDFGRIKHISDKNLIDSLEKNEFQFNVLSAKASIKVVDDKETSFKAHIRVKKDSAIWVSITPLLGIEMARVLITKDSVMFLNRIDKQYFVGTFDYINNKFGTDLDYQMLEAVIVGNSIEFEKEEKDIITNVDKKKHAYYISTEKKRKVRKDLKKDKNKLKELTQAIWLSPENFKIIELVLSTPKSDHSLVSKYSDFMELENNSFPQKIDVTLISEKIVNILIDYSKVSIEKEDISFIFKIPAKYEPVQTN